MNNRVFSFLASIKFAGIILFFIAILAIIGSFIPQGNEEAVKGKLASIFPNNSTVVYDFLNSTGFLNIYSSKIFIILLFLFGISLLLCTWRLVPFAVKGFRKINTDKFDCEMVSALTEDNIVDKIKNSGWKISKLDDSSGIIKISKHAIGRFGVIILHCGIILVMIGAFVGYLIGFKGFMNILEGTNDDVAVLPSGELRPLGFAVQCDKFIIEYYDNSTRPKSYTSHLSIIKDNVTVKTAVVDVNKPLKYSGTVFYQTSFGLYPNQNVKAIFSVTGRNGVKGYEEGFNSEFNLDGGYVGKVIDFAPALAVNEEGVLFSASEDMINPAILLEVYEKSEPVLRGWVLKNRPESGNFEELGFSLKFDGLWGALYTGLSVKNDPGTPVVYVGFLLIIIGILLIYVPNYTVIFIKIGEIDGQRIIYYTVKEQRSKRVLSPATGFIEIFVSKGGK